MTTAFLNFTQDAENQSGQVKVNVRKMFGDAAIFAIELKIDRYKKVTNTYVQNTH